MLQLSSFRALCLAALSFSLLAPTLSGCDSACPANVAGHVDVYVLVDDARAATSCPDDLLVAEVVGEDVEVEVICGTTQKDSAACECAIRSFQEGEHLVSLYVDGQLADSATADVVATDCGPGADDLTLQYPVDTGLGGSGGAP